MFPNRAARCVLFLLAMLLTAGHAVAAATDREAFEAARADIEAKLEPNREFGSLSTMEKREVRASLEKMAGLFARSERIEAMEEDDKVALFNEQEKLNVLLTRADRDDQVVCERVRATGTRLASNKCMTRRERREAREGGADWIRSLRPIGMNPGG